MKSRIICAVSSPRRCASSSWLRSCSISETACRSSSVAFSSASFMPANRWSSSSRPSRSLIFSYDSCACDDCQSYELSEFTAAAVEFGRLSSVISRSARSPSSIPASRASCLRSSSTASSRSFLTSSSVPSRRCSRSSSWRRRCTSRARSSSPRCSRPPRRMYSRSAPSGEYPAMTSSETDFSASARSTGGASGSGPPANRPYRDLLRRLSIQRLPVAGVLRDPARQVEALQRQLDRACALTGRRGAETLRQRVVRPVQARQGVEELLGGDLLARRHGHRPVERLDERAEVDAAVELPHSLSGRHAQQMVEDVAFAPLLAGLELDLASQHVDRALEVDDPRDSLVLAPDGRPVARCRRDRLGAGDRDACRDTRALVDGRRLAELSREPGQDLEQRLGQIGDEVGLLRDHGHLVLELQGVVRTDLRAEPVLQRRDDAAAVRVVLGVGRRDDEYVEGQPHHVPADLDVPLLHHVEHRDLDPLGEVGELVDRDDAAVTTGDEAEVDRFRLAEEYDVVARDERPLELRNDRTFEAVDARPRAAALRERGEKVPLDLLAQGLLDVPGGSQFRDRTDVRLAHVATLTPHTKSARASHGRIDALLERIGPLPERTGPLLERIGALPEHPGSGSVLLAVGLHGREVAGEALIALDVLHDVVEGHDGSYVDAVLGAYLADGRQITGPALLTVDRHDHARQLSAGRVNEIDDLADRRTGRDHVVDDEHPAGHLGADEQAALAVVLGFLAVERPRHVAGEVLGELHRGGRGERNALVRRAQQHVEIEVPRVDRRRVRPSESRQLHAGVELAGVEEVGRCTAGLERELPELQHLMGEGERDEVTLVVLHGASLGVTLNRDGVRPAETRLYPLGSTARLCGDSYPKGFTNEAEHGLYGSQDPIFRRRTGAGHPRDRLPQHRAADGRAVAVGRRHAGDVSGQDLPAVHAVQVQHRQEVAPPPATSQAKLRPHRPWFGL